MTKPQVRNETIITNETYYQLATFIAKVVNGLMLKRMIAKAQGQILLNIKSLTEINNMATIYNEIIINAPIEKIWEALSNIEELDKYDPTVKRSIAVSNVKYGIGAKRKVDMQDGKNWFEEEC